MPSSPDTNSDSTSPVPGARSALILLLAINLFNYIDRQVLSAVLPLLQLDGSLFDPFDANIQFKLGILGSAFMVSYMLFSPLVGWLDGHGYRRWIILGFGVSIWSVASGCSGFATSYWILLALRCLVGIGEGAYGPVASAILADAYPPRMRGKILAIFNMAIPVGSALGFIIGGQVSDYFDDWRHAFWVTFAGLILGLLCFIRRELPRATTRSKSEVVASYWMVLRRLLKIRSFVFCCLGTTAITFVLGGVAYWVPNYVFQREARFVLTSDVLDTAKNPPPATKRLPVPASFAERLRPKADGVERDYTQFRDWLKEELKTDEGREYFDRVKASATTADSPTLGSINFTFGVLLVVGGFLATAFGAWLGEKYRTRIRGAYFWVIGAGAIFAIPAFMAFLHLPLPLGWVAMFLAICGLFMHIGPSNTIIANVVTSETRANAFAINILIIHALGDVISPPLIGLVADQSSLKTAFELTAIMILASAILWFLGARHLDADTKAVEGF